MLKSSIELLKVAFGDIEKRYDGRISPVISTTYIESLDRVIGAGFWPGDLVAIGGMPASGKTTLAIQFLLSATHRLDFWPLGANASKLLALHPSRKSSEEFASVLIFAPKDGVKKYMLKILSAMRGAPLARISTAKLTSRDWAKLTCAAGRLNDLPITLGDVFPLTVSCIEKTVRDWKEDTPGPGLVVIDSLQFLVTDEGKKDMAEISVRLKCIARDTGVLFVVVSSFNNSDSASGNESSLNLGALGKLGAIGDDADTVILTDVIGSSDRPGTLFLAKHSQNVGCEIIVEPVWQKSYSHS